MQENSKFVTVIFSLHGLLFNQLAFLPVDDADDSIHAASGYVPSVTAQPQDVDCLMKTGQT